LNENWSLFPHAVGFVDLGVDLQEYSFINQLKIVCEVYGKLL